MPAAVQNFICDVGATFERVLTLKDADSVLINLTGSSATAQFLSEPGGTVLGTLTAAMGGAAGTITISYTAAQTAAIDVTGLTDATVIEVVDDDGVEIEATGPAGVIGVEVTYSDGNVQPLLAGTVVFNPRTCTG